ncbi:MAG: hypothetical protein GY780_12195 [bacterium]|nr:hypothetical protein [bacterium]
MKNITFSSARLSGLLILPVLAFALLCLPQTGLAEEKPEPKTTHIDTMVVSATKESIAENKHIVKEGELIDQVMQDTPFTLIRRGNGKVSDLYSDGLKRNDITVTIDGERTCTACPNRMDTRVSQVDLGDIEEVDMSRSSAGLQAGLGGQVNFKRRLPGEEKMIYGKVSGAFDHSEEFDGTLSVEGNGMRLSGMYTTYNPYTDANDGTFSEKYGYAEEVSTTVYEVRGHAAFDGGDATASYNNAEDVLFPYLLMDERTNDLYQASVSYKGNRLYFNHTAHLMDNYLRNSANMTDMVTDATTTMMGVVSENYEIYARNWDADNHITPLANPAMGTVNHMLPDVWRLGGRFKYEVGDTNNPWLFMHAGVVNTKIGDDDQLDLYRQLQPDAESDSWSIPLGITATHMVDVNKKCVLTMAAELSSDAPSIEQQYIATKKPGTKPDWVGNPDLKDPVRATGRVSLQRSIFQLEFFGTHVWNYPYLVKRSANSAMFLTYEGIDALLAGANLHGKWKFMQAGVTWNWGEKTEDSSAMAEIQPLTAYLGLTSPQYGMFTGTAMYQHSTGQDRIDASLDEETTGAWNRVDVGVEMEKDDFLLKLSVDNATNSYYTQHLSYLRNPFASGIRVYEPGRVYRVTGTFKF